MSSDLTTDSWAPPAAEVLVELPDDPSDRVGRAHPLRLAQELDAVSTDRGHETTVAAPSSTKSGLKARLACLDVVAAATAWAVLGGIAMPPSTGTRRWGAALAALVVTLVAMRLNQLYLSRRCVQRGHEVGRIFVCVVAGAVALELVRGDWSRTNLQVILAAGTCLIALVALRSLFAQWLHAQRAMGRYLRPVIMVGINEDALAVRTLLDTQPEIGYEVRGVIGSSRSCSGWDRLAIGRTLDDLPDMARHTSATGILLVANALSASDVQRAIELGAVEGLHVQVWPGFRGLRTRRIRWLPMSGEAFLYVEPDRHPRWEIVAKRAIDVFLAAFGIVITAPILATAAIAICLTDHGPALFRQIRIGLRGQPFELYKLRTMTVTKATDELEIINERRGGPLFKATHDPRVTRVGAVLRALSIDELPQLFNVLTGSMSLVGPRPALPCEVDQFDGELLRRHNVKPGVTGLWQLEARDNPSFHAYRRLDLLYVDNWSISLDAFIIVATVPMVLTRTFSIYRHDRQQRQTNYESWAGAERGHARHPQ